MISKALVAASTKPIILSILLRGEDYGYQIIQRVKEVSGGTLEWSDNMLYPVLHRLESEGFIVSRWKISEGGRLRTKFLTLKALDLLERDSETVEMWKKPIREAVTALLERLERLSIIRPVANCFYEKLPFLVLKPKKWTSHYRCHPADSYRG